MKIRHIISQSFKVSDREILQTVEKEFFISGQLQKGMMLWYSFYSHDERTKVKDVLYLIGEDSYYIEMETINISPKRLEDLKKLLYLHLKNGWKAISPDLKDKTLDN